MAREEWIAAYRDLLPLLNSRTRLVTTSLVSFYNGYRINLSEIAGAVRKHSPALIAVDVTQALGRIELNLSDADLIVSSTHKWLLATHGGVFDRSSQSPGCAMDGVSRRLVQFNRRLRSQPF